MPRRTPAKRRNRRNYAQGGAVDFRGPAPEFVGPEYPESFAQPTPRNGVLGLIADALSKAKQVGDARWAPGDDAEYMAAMRRDMGVKQPSAGALQYQQGSVPLGSMLLGQAPEEVNEWSYGNAPFDIPRMGTQLPRVAPGHAQGVMDALLLGMGAGPALKPAAKGALGAIGDVLGTPGRVAAGPWAQRGAVRARGGNFDEQSLQDYLREIAGGREVPDRGAAPTVDWAQKQLANYLRRDIGSPADPLLQVEKEVPGLHLPEEALDRNQMVLQMLNARPGNPGSYAARNYALTNGPLTPWGYYSDSALNAKTVGRELDANQRLFKQGSIAEIPAWMQKADPAAPYTGIDNQVGDALGFGHVLDYLDAAQQGRSKIAEHGSVAPSDVEKVYQGMINGNNLLPFAQNDINAWRNLEAAGLALSPEQISKTSVADAVRKTARWNELMAAAQGGANPDLQRGISAVHKEYPDGMKWVRTDQDGPEDVSKLELPDTHELVHSTSTVVPKNMHGYYVAPKGGSLTGVPSATAEDAKTKFLRQQERRAGLGAEGDVMGHCVGSNCDSTYKNSTIYSLRDAKGTPHVTVEVRKPERYALDWYNGVATPAQRTEISAGLSKGDKASALVLRDRVQNSPHYQAYVAENPPQPEIHQIKGRANAAPIAKYLPYVQDFVRGEGAGWGAVHELENTGLRKVPTAQRYMTGVELKALATPEKLAAWRKYAPARTEHLTDEQLLTNQLAPGSLDNTEEDFLNILLDHTPPRPAGYAQGGAVTAPTTGFGARLAEPRAYTGKFSAAVAQRCNCKA